MKTARKTTTLNAEVWEIGEKLAKQENRTLTNYIETLLLRTWERQQSLSNGGIWPAFTIEKESLKNQDITPKKTKAE